MVFIQVTLCKPKVCYLLLINAHHKKFPLVASNKQQILRFYLFILQIKVYECTLKQNNDAPYFAVACDYKTINHLM